eukprot:CAMPEP_0169097564 /NCGR_PEP_ID=MMETSP1015-20121227/19585_1 /TAXON_ID=342587 /ORGANISM="Karlodinium micrum, Strain CCMP2283" /LENGTH=529 /DNA_ID=CAMNT_0009158375 /DNA_START=151 /DNA_END=1737 /DNA_ORIENTATION=+
MSMAMNGAPNGIMTVSGESDMNSAGAMSMLPPPPSAPTVPDPAIASVGAQVPTMPMSFPSVDTSMAQAYAQLYSSYLQQAQQAAAYASLGATDAVASTASMTASSPTLSGYSCAPSMPMPAAISVSVEGMRYQYQLTEDDLQKVFSRYGTVQQIKVDEVGTTALIHFGDYTYAQAAMNDLHGKVLNGLEGTLKITWAGDAGSTATMAAPYVVSSYPADNWNFSVAAPWSSAPTASPLATLGGGLGADLSSPSAAMSPLIGGSPTPGTPPPNSGAHSPMTEGKAPQHVKGVRKYTCRFLIGIENDKDFQVVRRIIGAKGSNMKRIVKQSEAKLRLRGVGSGYFEGACRKESNEPLQLCVSCTSSDGYRTAVSLVEELMEGVYSEYRTFCRESGRPELDLHATPQLVSSGRDRGMEQLFMDGSPESPPKQSLEYDDEDDDFFGALGKREGGRRRGRRSRGRKTETGKVEGEPPRNAPSVDEILEMIDQRNEARRQCNFSEADRIRQSLHERGVALMDEPGGRGKASEVTTW